MGGDICLDNEILPKSFPVIVGKQRYCDCKSEQIMTEFLSWGELSPVPIHPKGAVFY